jgi:hypothetical protein
MNKLSQVKGTESSSKQTQRVNLSCEADLGPCLGVASWVRNRQVATPEKGIQPGPRTELNKPEVPFKIVKKAWQKGGQLHEFGAYKTNNLTHRGSQPTYRTIPTGLKGDSNEENRENH